MAETGSSLELRHLVKHFGSLCVLDDVDAHIESGSFTAILGPSGSGKSTLLMTIAGFELPESGAVVIDSVDVTHTPPERRGIGVVFQGYALFPHLSVADNIAYPLRARGWKKALISERVRDMAALMEIDALLHRFPAQLSGGQRQRVAIARALAFQPRLLLLDEPLSALDRSLRDRMKAELQRLHRKIGVTIVMVTHDQDEASALADNIIVMEDGAIIATGTARELYEAPTSATIAAFFGRANLLRIIERRDGRVAIDGHWVDAVETDEGGQLLLVRPEAFELVPEGSGLRAEVVSSVFHAGRIALIATTGSGETLSVDLDDATAAHLAEGDIIHLKIIRSRTVGEKATSE